jgi:hypothetical protein
MDRLTPARVVVVAAAALASSACPSNRADGPPPPESLEIVSAAPGAVGALAAGTDAAPPVVQPNPEEALGEAEESPPGGDAGVPEGGAVEEPENLPL